jgi:putative nucleotidyltransferase with HDIG domain
MNGRLISAYQDWFDAYVRSFDTNDPQLRANLDLKAAHTRRVCRSIVTMLASLGPLKVDRDLVFLAALFHDVGRFSQLKSYGTFNDSRSEDHAALGLKVLEEYSVLDDLDEEDHHTICKAIQIHNKYEIPVGNPDFTLICRLLRDADKLDILGLITVHMQNRDETPNRALDFGLDDSPGISSSVLSDISKRRMARIGAMENLNDMRLMYISWVFDINFPLTLSLIIERRYLDKLFQYLPAGSEREEIEHQVTSYVQDKQRIWI